MRGWAKFVLNRKLSNEERRPVYANIAGVNWNKQREARYIKSYSPRLRVSSRIRRELMVENLRELRLL